VEIKEVGTRAGRDRQIYRLVDPKQMQSFVDPADGKFRQGVQQQFSKRVTSTREHTVMHAFPDRKFLISLGFPVIFFCDFSGTGSLGGGGGGGDQRCLYF
jgi:hypothetical protein